MGLSEKDGGAVTQDVRAPEPGGLGGRVVDRVEGRHGDVALVPQARGCVVGLADRDEHTRAGRRQGAGAQDRVRVERQPGRRLILAAEVAAAPAQEFAPARCIDGGADAGVIGQVAELERVDRQLDAGGPGLDSPDRLGQPLTQGQPSAAEV